MIPYDGSLPLRFLNTKWFYVRTIFRILPVCHRYFFRFPNPPVPRFQMKNHFLPTLFVSFLFGLICSAGLFGANPEPLFDGETLQGWEGDPDWWDVREGKIVGGSNRRDIPNNTFLMTEASFQNFELVMQIRLRGKGDRPNSGIQVRSARVPDSPEVEGYQVDVGDGYWGKLYDERRRGWLVGTGNNTIEKGKKAANSSGWNKYRIRCEGPTISAWINGTKMFEYTETDESIPLNGKIGIQVHGGGPTLVEVKKAVVRRLPASENVPTWPEDRLELQKTDNLYQFKQANLLTDDQISKAVGLGKQVEIEQEPKTPAEQKESFILPDDFDIELVASETDEVGKFIDVTWDTAGNMWTMTGMEYPVSTGGSEPSKDVYRLFENGGKDRVLMYPRPYGSGPHAHKTFVDGMVQPLGILPYRSGAFVQYGRDIRYYRDTNDDGRADEYDTILTGFGIQDSHLFPHRFKLSPSGWIYTGQGMFNKSRVRRPEGKPFQDGRTSIEYNHTKLARFRPDGSRFEIRTWGPSNIWGHVFDRYGEGFIQEANDRGYPVVQLKPGAQYDTTPYNESKPYTKDVPKSFSKLLMGGTGLSGLALADDQGKDGWPVPWGHSTKETKRFLVANPISNRIQRVKAEWTGTHYEYEKQSPLLLTRDEWFRPVAIHFGPDGGLYVVDWYNKIISHNEIPIVHEERDKKRGRIWRIYHKDQRRDAARDLTRLDPRQLLSVLGHNHTKQSRLAWQEIQRRNATDLIPDLKNIIASPEADDDRRIAALRALEGLKNPSTDLLVTLLNEKNGNLRTEAVRIIDEHELLSDRLLDELHKRIQDPHHLVRGAIATLVWRRRFEGLSDALIRLGLELGGASATTGHRWERYYGHYERSLIRWALEDRQKDLRSLLASGNSFSASSPARAFAGFVLQSKRGAQILAGAASQLDRPLTEEEVSYLSSHVQQPKVQNQVVALLSTQRHRTSAFEILSNLRKGEVTPTVQSTVRDEIRTLLSSNPDPEELQYISGLDGLVKLNDQLEKKIKKHTDPVLHVMKSGQGFAESNITLEGAFTVESWVKLDPPITNEHHLIGSETVDFNFHNAKFRVWIDGSDEIIANTEIKPRTWTHVAVTRDENGNFRIYMNGELDQDQSNANDRTLTNLQIGTGTKKGASAYYTEFRVWSERRTAEQIRDNVQRTFRDRSAPSRLKHHYHGKEWPPLNGKAEISQALDLPELKP